MIVPAPRFRVFARCAISVPKSKVMSWPASARPNGAPFRSTLSTPCSLPSRQALAQRVGRDRTPATAPRRAWTGGSRSPWRARPGSGCASETSLTSPTNLTCASASSRDTPRGTSSVTTAISASRSQPQASSASGIGSRGAEHLVGAALVHQRIGPEALRHLRAARFPHQLDMVHIGRAVRPLIGARQAARRPRARGSGRAGSHHGRGRWRAAPAAAPSASQSSSARLQCRRDMAGVRAPGEIADTTTSRPSRPAFREPSFIPFSSVILTKVRIHEHGLFELGAIRVHGSRIKSGMTQEGQLAFPFPLG